MCCPPYSSQVVSLKVPEKLPSGLTYSTVPQLPAPLANTNLYCLSSAKVKPCATAGCRAPVASGGSEGVGGGRVSPQPARVRGDHSGQSEGRCVVYPHLIHLMPVRWIQCTTFC